MADTFRLWCGTAETDMVELTMPTNHFGTPNRVYAVYRSLGKICSS
jgi:hypothetical protein